MFDTYFVDRSSATDEEKGDAIPVADPLADLLLSVAAVIVLAVIAILPTVPDHFEGSANPGRTDGKKQKNIEFLLKGRTVEPFFATRSGLLISANSSHLVPTDRIFLDGSVVDALTRIRSAGDPLVLFIEPEGLESAFQLDVLANRYGPQTVHQIRLESKCISNGGGVISFECGRRSR